MDSSLVNHYAAMADKMARDPISIDQGRATVPMGRGFKLWLRFNKGADLVWVTTLDGRQVALTPKQAQVYDLARTYIDKDMVTMRLLSDELQVAPSTVYRALVKLASWGLIGYITGRGRYGGTLLFSRGKNDGLDRFAKAAKAKLNEWRLAAEARILRTKERVAPYLIERKRGQELDSLYYYLTTISKDATMVLQRPWTAEDMAEIDAATS